MKNPFYNSEEHRLRAVWRLLLFSGLNLVAALTLQAILGIILGVIAAVSGVDLSNPQAVQVSILRNPYLPALSAVVTLFATGLVTLLAVRIDGRPLADFGFRFNGVWWRDFGFGLLLGALLMTVIFVVELAAGWVTITSVLNSTIPNQSFGTGLLLSLVLFFCVGIYEEMLSRGYQLRNMAEGMRGKYLNPRTALLAAYVISSILFGILHAANPNASFISTLYLMTAGLLLGLGFVLTGDLAIPIGLHMAWNFFQGSVFGFPVSGMTIGASFIAIKQSGPEIITGGVFGPEAGLIGLFAIALGSFLIIQWLRWTRGAARIEQRLAVYTPAPVPVKTIAPAAGQPEQ
jgi:membrane protease YdiL (CAAX protease family)